MNLWSKICAAALGINAALVIWEGFHHDWLGVAVAFQSALIFGLVLCLRHATGKL